MKRYQTHLLIFGFLIILLGSYFIFVMEPRSKDAAESAAVIPDVVTDFESCKLKGGELISEFPTRCIYEGRDYLKL